MKEYVKCNYKFEDTPITYGKIYEVQEYKDNRNTIVIINDRGFIHPLGSFYFDSIGEEEYFEQEKGTAKMVNLTNIHDVNIMEKYSNENLVNEAENIIQDGKDYNQEYLTLVISIIKYYHKNDKLSDKQRRSLHHFTTNK